MPNMFDEWRADHESHRTLLAMIDSETDDERRLGLFSHLARELCVHMAIEERTLYARLAMSEEMRRRASHSILEHQDIEELLETLYAMDIDNPYWRRTFGVLRELIERHEAEEDESLFSEAAEVFDVDDAVLLGRNFVKERRRIATETFTPANV
ncbi:MAG: hemerythrin domain-containing protein [Thiohalobacteraceae bacterium]